MRMLVSMRFFVRMSVAVSMRMLLVVARMLMIVIVRMLMLFSRLAVLEDLYFDRGDSAAIDLAERERCIQIESFYRIVKNFSWNAGVDQCCKKHVATDAGKAVEISDAHESYCFTLAGVMAVAGRISFIEPER